MKMLSGLFGRSPFVHVVDHGRKVEECVVRLSSLLSVVLEGESEEEIRRLAAEVSELETEADQVRNRIHEVLSGKLMLPVSRSDLFDTVEQQDSMADMAEEIATSFTFRPLPLPDVIRDKIAHFISIVLENCTLASGVISKVELLIESSFADRDTETVMKLINELRGRDDSTRDACLEATRKIYAADESLSPVEIILWVKIVSLLQELSAYSDKTANGIRIIIENQRN